MKILPQGMWSFILTMPTTSLGTEDTAINESPYLQGGHSQAGRKLNR